MHITNLTNKSICILGYGREGQSTYKRLTTNAITNHITIADDKRLSNTPSNITLHDDGQRTNHLADYDIIIRTAGIAPHTDMLTPYQDRITSQTQILFDNYTGKTIAVTGTKGKSTTSTLITHILQRAGYSATLVGNIGDPVLSYSDLFDTSTHPDYIVCELSSFQLTNASIDPTYALITNLLIDHIDRHGSIGHYHRAKFNIIGPGTTLIAHASIVDKLPSTYLGSHTIFAGSGTEYDYDSSMFATPDRHYPTDIALPGDHNRENICLINALMHQLHITPDHIYHTIKSFAGLPHRMQTISTANNITRINDSQSTNPSTCITAVKTFSNKISTLILGGYQSHFDYTDVLETIRQYPSIQTLILFPDTIDDFRRHITTDDIRQVFDVSSMSEAVDIAREHTQPGHICLLSPGAKSFSLWTSMSARGDAFAECIENHP